MLERKKMETDDKETKVLFYISKYETCFVPNIARIVKAVQCLVIMTVLISGFQLSEMSTSLQEFICSYDTSMSSFIAYKD